MNRLFHKAKIKNLLLLLLTVCLITESAFVPNLSTVYAAATTTSNNATPDETASPTNTEPSNDTASSGSETTSLDTDTSKSEINDFSSTTDHSDNVDSSSSSDSSESVDSSASSNSSKSMDSSTSGSPESVDSSTPSDNSESVNSSTPSDNSEPVDSSTSFDSTKTSDSSTSDGTKSTTESAETTNTDANDQSDAELAISKEIFPDDKFRDYISTHFDHDKNNKLSDEEITQVENVDLSNMGISDLTGIEYFTNIVYLYCNGNQLRSLSVGTLTHMTVLDCSYNNLTSLDLENCSSLVSLECENNAVTITLDKNNSFDLAKLEGFNINRSSDWSENVVLENDLLTLKEDSNTSLITYHYQVNAPLISNSSLDFTMVVSSNSFDQEKINISKESFPDDSFRDYIKEHYDLNQDSILSLEEINDVTYLYIPEKNIISLSGIEYFSNLVFLNCEGNCINSFDVNTLSNLKGINCSNNQLVDLSIDKLTQLEELYCSQNQLTNLDVNQLTKLTKLYCDHNLLTTLDTSSLSNLLELNVNSNQLYCLDLNSNPLLESIECTDNLYEISSQNNSVDLTVLTNLDLTRTNNWSDGTIKDDNTLLLESNQPVDTITYTYMNQALNLSNADITFTLKILPKEQEHENMLAKPQSENTVETQTDISPEASMTNQSDAPTQPKESEAPIVETPVTTYPADTSTPAPITYSINFNSDGGSDIVSQSVSENNLASQPGNPTKAGCLFEGWYHDDALFDFNTQITSDITLTAHWNKISLSRPKIKRLKNTKKSKVKITLKSAKNIDGYKIYYSTYKNAKKKAIKVTTKKKSLYIKNLVKGKTYYVRVRTYAIDSTGKKIYSKYSKIKKIKIKRGLKEAKATGTSARIKSCKLTKGNNVYIKAKAKNIIKSKDNYYYLFALSSNKTKISKKASPLKKVIKSTSFKFKTPLNLNSSKNLLYSKFVVAVKLKSHYKVISTAKFITNPGKNAQYTYSFPKAATKKGLQINADMLNDVKDLGVKNSAFNIPLDYIIAASGEKNYHSSVDYEYNGKTYWFRKGMIRAYDSLFRNLENQDIVVTAIILLGWRDDLTYLISPSGREQGHNYYNFNTQGKKAREQLEATLSFLAERYASDNGNGKIVNWIIGNEVNSFDSWNYAGKKSLSKYTKLYADSYRLAYNAIKSVYRNARLYVSLDQNWTHSSSINFSGKEFLQEFNSRLKKNGKIKWNIAYHAYPSPLTDPRFWKNKNGLTQNNKNSPVISIYNISVLTKYVKKHYGKKTRIILSEQGFTSSYGEKTQAAAIAYAYYLAEFNSMIDAFILSRHVDNIAETKDGLYLGLWTNRPGCVEEAYHKKYAWKVYKYMDTPSSTRVTKFALKIIKKKRWKKVIPKYKSKKFRSMPEAN